MQDYYAELQVSPKAEPGVIAAAYRYLARAHHPDVTGATDDERMRRLNAAYEVLGDPVRRRAYDESRRPRSPDDLSLPVAPLATRAYGAHRPWFHVASIVAISLLAAAGIVFVTGEQPHGTARASVSASVPRRAATTVVRPVAVRPPVSPLPQSSVPHHVQDEPAAAAAPEHLPASVGPETAADVEWMPSRTPAEPAADRLPETIRPPPVTPAPVAVGMPAPPPAPVQYIVQPGDYLGSIARTFGVTAEAIAAANALPNPDTIHAGTLLRIPQ
jgi:hypothetical protein